MIVNTGKIKDVSWGVDVVRCRGCGSGYGSAIVYCKVCDGNIEQINQFIRNGFKIVGNKFVKQGGLKFQKTKRIREK